MVKTPSEINEINSFSVSASKSHVTLSGSIEQMNQLVERIKIATNDMSEENGDIGSAQKDN